MVQTEGKKLSHLRREGGIHNFSHYGALRRKLEIHAVLDPPDMEILSILEADNYPIQAGTEFFHAGQEFTDVSYVLQEGWAMRWKIVENGNRQIINYILPGDFITLDSLVFDVLCYSITAITDIVVSRFSNQVLVDSLKISPGLTRAVAWSVAQDERYLINRLISLGQHNASQRVAHFLIEIHERLEAIGLNVDDTFPLPIKQVHLADSIGLSVVHVNRILSQLRDQRFIRLHRGTIWLSNLSGLRDIAGIAADRN